MYESIMQIIVDATVALMPIAAGYVIHLIKQYVEEQKRAGKQQEVVQIKRIAKASVSAVEMIAQAAGFDGRAKLGEAVRRARSVGENQNIRLSDEQWQTFIEEAVLNLRSIGEEVTRAE